MIQDYRQWYNTAFEQAKYEALLADIESTYRRKVLFRVAETPVFVPKYLKERLRMAGNDIIDVILRPDIKALTERAIPENLQVPHEDNHPNFICVDFAICEDEEGQLTPQLIEFQGFPSLYGWQEVVASGYKKHFDIPQELDFYIDCQDRKEYIHLLSQCILGKYKPEEVILLEIKPEEQKTNIDFYILEKWLQVRPVCLSELRSEGDQLYYLLDGQKMPVKRIYNRVIFDDLAHQQDFIPGVDLTRPYDVEWAGHPNWFFRLSKFTMPYIDSPYVPKTTFLSDFDTIPADLENYVLKPLFSFSGQGVIFNVTEADIEAIAPDRRNEFIMQRKVAYASVLEAPNGKVKVEIRLLYLWPDGHQRPVLAANLTRLSKGVMIGVRYNENQDWVGGSVSFMER
jgi:hypothetical protein